LAICRPSALICINITKNSQNKFDEDRFFNVARRYIRHYEKKLAEGKKYPEVDGVKVELNSSTKFDIEIVVPRSLRKHITPALLQRLTASRNNNNITLVLETFP
jgi:hypothetical protein